MEDLLKRAIEIAREAHLGQVDKAGADYINHPLRVSGYCKNPIAKIVAILHDTVEDTFVTLDGLRDEGFPEFIVSSIDNLTRREGESYRNFILRCKSNSISREVKLADLKDNMDLSRIPNPSREDFRRLEKYKKATEELLS